MRGDEHYREAELLLTKARGVPRDEREERYLLNAALVHATLAHAAAVIEAADQQIDQNLTRPLAVRPHPGDDLDPPYPGSPWGRAFYGDRHLDTNQEH